MKRLLMAFLLVACAMPAMAAEPPSAAEPPTVEQSIPNRVLEAPEQKLVGITIENDSLGGGTDKNYTSGVRINFTDMHEKLPDIAYELDKLIPGFEINKTTLLYYSLGQNIYTPRVITSTVANPNDRPWAAFLYGSMGMATLKDNHVDEVEATLGVVGPAALGEPTQKLIHHYLTDSPTPEGWSHQLKNEPGVMLAWQRSWPQAVSHRAGDNFWSLKPYAGATVGNIHTYADVGLAWRMSPYESRWQDTPIRVRPAMPGTGFYEIPRNKWSWELFSGVEGRAVARDIFLDGNTFADSYSIEKKPFVADATAGFAFIYGKTRFGYTAVYRTKEFVGQDHPEIFGAVSVAYRF